MKKYPEWFVGGPLHGIDRLTGPFAGWTAVRSERYLYLVTDKYIKYEDLSIVNDRLYSTEEWRYRWCKFHIGTMIIYFWADTRRMSQEDIASLFGELVMAPHAMEGADSDRRN